MKYLSPDEPIDAAGAERELEDVADRVQPGWRELTVTSGRLEARVLNGMPALVVSIDDPPPRVAPRVVVRCKLAPDGRIEQVHVVLARRKLQALSA